jgi:hypothetical protein
MMAQHRQNTPSTLSTWVARRDPALLAALAATAIKLFSAFVIDLSIGQQSALNAVVAAGAGLAVAFMVKDGQVAAILGIAQALIALAVGFGLRIDADNQALIMSFIQLTVGAFERTQVTAPAPPPT